MKHRILLFIICSLFYTAASCQGYRIDRTTHDFSDIEAGSLRVADFTITNTGKEDLFFLRADMPDNCLIRYSQQRIVAGENGIVRIKVNPEHTGPSQWKVSLYLSSAPAPVILTLKGNVKIVEYADLSCPDFNTPAEEKQVHQVFTVQVVNRKTMQPISHAEVRFEPSPTLMPFTYTSQEGKVKRELPVDLYDIDVKAKGYLPGSQSLYVGKGITSTVILLDPLQDLSADTTLLAVDLPVEEKQPEPEKKQTPARDTSIFVENPGELSAKEYAPNNIVFLIDVSSSMASPEKLPLLKVSMKKLLYSLRSIDRVSIVTYASGTDVVLTSTSASQKDFIASRIDGLRAFGGTEGGKGIREAYKVANDNFIRKGNNQIILATDGDFNLDKSDNALFRFVGRKSFEGISMSVVGFGHNKRAIEKMQNLASHGSGSYIHIGSPTEAETVLLDEVKLRSKK